MITKKTKYALKALGVLAEGYASGLPLLIGDISEREKVPKKFLEIILLELKNKGILTSKKGKGGGYFLAAAPETISLTRVLRALEGPLAPMPCLSKTAHAKCDDCTDEEACGIKKLMRDVYEAQLEKLEKKTLKDLSDCCQNAKPEMMYYI